MIYSIIRAKISEKIHIVLTNSTLNHNMTQDWINFPQNIDNIFGIIYLIRNHHPDAKQKYYIGTKQILKRIKRKPLKGKTRNRIDFIDNGIQKYWGSSKRLLTDIETYGIQFFTREVIETCNSKFHCKFAELDWQMKCNALFDDSFYNNIINVRLGVVPKDFKNTERNPETLNL
jgi:hypothetical protein